MGSNVICIRSKKSLDKEPTAIKDCGNHFKVFIPSCYRNRTIDEMQEVLDLYEPKEPTMKERVEAIDNLPKVVQVVYYRIGALHEQV